MSKQIFLFDGGLYKANEDNGRVRVPLTPEEAQLVFYDPEIPGDTDNSIGSTLDMGVYASQFAGLEVGDEIFVGLVPDAVVLRGIWMNAFDAIEGFKVKADLVSVPDVYENLGEAQPTFEGTASLEYDFKDGLGHATIDAIGEAKFWGGEASDYRNLEALKAKFFDQTLAPLGQSTYLRITVVELGEFGENAPDGCCAGCGQKRYPTFQIGAIYDRICVDKQRVRNFCNCNESTGSEEAGVTGNANVNIEV